MGGHSEAQGQRTLRVANHVAVQILRRAHQGLPNHRTARVWTVDAEIIRALESRNLFSVHDVRQLLANATEGNDWVKGEEVSEAAKLVIRRCARRGWTKPRASYPGQWEITARFYLRPNQLTA